MLNQQMLAVLQAMQQGPQPNFPPVVGRAPPQQPLPSPTMGNHMVPQGAYGQQAGLLGGGPYQQQAAQLAGLLGGPGPGILGNQGPIKPFTPGMFMPGFRPGIDQPSPGGGGKTPYHMRQV